MCNDIYQELLGVISMENCISEDEYVFKDGILLSFI